MSQRKKKKLAKVTTPPSNQKHPIKPPNNNPEPLDSPIQHTPSTTNTPNFHDLGISNPLCTECTSHGYKTPTPIQTQCIPLALSGRDMISLAETGSGRTAAFVLPILKSLIHKLGRLHSLILAPIRELASRIATVVGIWEAISLAKKPHVIVATLGRLLDDLENTKGFSMRELKYLVLDDADRLLDCDFGPVLDRILKVLPGRTTYLFSVTMSSKVETLQRASLTDPVRVSVSKQRRTSATLLQCYALRLTIMLRNLGFPAIHIHGQLSQSARLASLNKFRSRSQNILIATDVAARGIDIPSVDLVVNYDLPEDSKTYTHRVGRTARAGKSGIAVSIVTQYAYKTYLRIEEVLRKKLGEYKIPRDEAMLFPERVSDA
ncbi:DEAD/DEAH box helicase [Aspergillus glaucus CBS 516.65]|uniref:ATP-dependent rRNA helicase RRP3 n=1 Tax=Aspergillus glaucus CBS 516.65 TaxID=1160497 RepID=A0A1L9VJ33_ASPGL|nr:hypothetical protein ASPGLDRAFT_74658 [Aspergillus glaucus CBS 516.65]OJJ83904.1 hypothetical protein ASPGLDRAFT_74658 [Aspergillus glaucus CBS 516.65]